jgi:hypothetical protein
MVRFELAAKIETEGEELSWGHRGWALAGFANVIEGGPGMAEPGMLVSMGVRNLLNITIFMMLNRELTK